MRIRKSLFDGDTGGLSAGPEGIAIVGMACLFPGAPDLEEYWRNIEHGVDAISEVPSDRWDPVYYDPASHAVDRFYCRRGGFVDAHASFDALSFGVMPVAAEGAEPDQLLALQVAARALADAGYNDDRPMQRERTGVILGRGGYMGAGMARLNDHVRTAQQLVECLRALVPSLGTKELEEVRAEFRAQLGHVGPDSAIGLVPNLAASRIANRLDLKGPAYTVDAACASSLVAVDHACRELREKRCDVVLCGGVHLCHDPTFWSVFCQLGALSRNQQIRPFDRKADGLLIGEGIGIVVLKRYFDARRDNDRIYAVIRGTGVASDGREASLMQPRIEGQLLALQRAWDEAALDPKSLGLLEAHGTATPAGDGAEISTVSRFFGAHQARRVIGSVKSQIGHTMPAAGAAGLIKAALACYHGVLPPSLHCDEPHERLSDSGFRVLAKAEPWDENGGHRRAAVNAFGFGGINAHVILDASSKEQTGRVFLPTGKHRLPPQRTTLPEDAAERMLFLAAPDAASLIAKIDDRDDSIGEGPCRLVLVDPTPERRAKARAIVAKGVAARSGRDGIVFAPTGLATEGGKVALLFPGVDASFKPRVDDLATYFRLPLPTHIEGGDLESIGMGIIGVGRLMHSVLARLGLEADMVAGHSIGEWSGMLATGVVPEDAADRFIDSLVPGSLEVPGVVFAAAGCSEEVAHEALEGLPEIAISHDNCPHQILMCGREESVDEAVRRLLANGVLCQKLPFRSGFHSPLFGPFIEPHRRNFERLPLRPPATPLWSATTCAEYPADPDGIRKLALDHLVEPVRFRTLVERMYDAGARIFVQAGTGSLVGFVGDTLRGKPHMVVSANVPQRSGLAQLHRMAAALWVEGVGIDLARLPLRRNRAIKKSRDIVLPLGAPLARLSKELALEARTQALDEIVHGSDPVMLELAVTLREMQRAKDDVMRAYNAYTTDVAARPRPPQKLGPRETTRRMKLSLETFPELVDHTFYRQPNDWPNPADRFPVVPMTTTIQTMMDLASELVPELTPIALERVRALRWIAVEPPVELVIHAKFDGDKRVDVTIEGYASASVRMSASYPAAPRATPMTFANAKPAPVTAEELYTKRWMFHGPKFQGVVEMGEVGDDGLRGTLIGLPTKGALLDNAGQLFGYWVMLKNENDRLAFPFRVDRFTFFGPEPEPGTKLECGVRILEMNERLVRADIELSVDGVMWAHIEGWEDRRFESDAHLWPVLQWPENNVYARARNGGYVLARECWRSSASRDLIAKRYLSESEREQYERAGLRSQRGFLLGRIAIKDAVRSYLLDNGVSSVFPIEVAVANEPSGRPYVSGPFKSDLRVSVAHKDTIAVAVIGIGHDVGVDIERIEHRGADFESITFTNGELEILPKVDRDLWVTRFWVAKEAVAKARGTGLMGAPRRFVVTEIAGECLKVGDLWVETYVEGEHVVGVTRVV